MCRRSAAPHSKEPQQPREEVHLTRKAAATPAEPKKKRSKVRTLLKWTGLTAAGLVTGISAVGGIAYFGNREALHTPPSVSLTLDLETQLQAQGDPTSFPDLPLPLGRAQTGQPASSVVVSSPTRATQPQRTGGVLGLTPASTSPRLPEPGVAVSPVVESRTPAPPEKGGLTLMVPVAQAGDWARNVRRQELVQETIRQEITTQTSRLNDQLGRVELPDGEFLIDLTVPMPTGEQALLHLGNLNLPSLGYRSFTQETLPLTVKLDGARVTSGLTVNAKQVDAEPVRPDTLKGPGVYLSSLQVEIRSDREVSTVEGQAAMELDLDGTATARRRARLQELGSTESAKVLESRLESTRGLKERLKAGGVEDLLRDAFQNQQIDFSVGVRTGKGTLARITYHVWLGQDADGDGQADLHLAQVSELDRLNEIEVSFQRLERRGELPDGWLSKAANEQVAAQFHQNIRRGVSQALSQLPHHAGDGLNRALAEIRIQGNQEAKKLLGRTTLRAEGQNFSLDSLRIEDGHLIAGIDGKTEFERNPNALPQSFLEGDHSLIAVISGGELNAHLANPERVPWGRILEKVNQANPGRNISLAKNKRGQTIYPRLMWKDGMPALRAQLVIEQEAPKEETRVGRFFRQLVTPERMETEVTLPFQLLSRDGDLAAQPLVEQIEVRQNRGDSLELVDLLPDQALSKILGSLATQETGPIALELGLQQRGLEPASVVVTEGPNQSPTIAVGLKAAPDLVQQLMSR